MTDTSETLTAVDKKRYRGIAQRLKPHVHVGRQGMTPTVIAALDTALRKNELIKVRFEGDRLEVREMATAVATATRSEAVGSVGKTASFFRRKEEQ